MIQVCGDLFGRARDAVAGVVGYVTGGDRGVGAVARSALHSLSCNIQRSARLYLLSSKPRYHLMQDIVALMPSEDRGAVEKILLSLLDRMSVKGGKGLLSAVLRVPAQDRASVVQDCQLFLGHVTANDCLVKIHRTIQRVPVEDRPSVLQACQPFIDQWKCLSNLSELMTFVYLLVAISGCGQQQAFRARVEEEKASLPQRQQAVLGVLLGMQGDPRLEELVQLQLKSFINVLYALLLVPQSEWTQVIDGSLQHKQALKERNDALKYVLSLGNGQVKESSKQHLIGVLLEKADNEMVTRWYAKYVLEQRGHYPLCDHDPLYAIAFGRYASTVPFNEDVQTLNAKIQANSQWLKG